MATTRLCIYLVAADRSTGTKVAEAYDEVMAKKILGLLNRTRKRGLDSEYEIEPPEEYGTHNLVSWDDQKITSWAQVHSVFGDTSKIPAALPSLVERAPRRSTDPTEVTFNYPGGPWKPVKRNLTDAEAGEFITAKGTDPQYLYRTRTYKPR